MAPLFDEVEESCQQICLLVKTWFGSTSRQYWSIFWRVMPEEQEPDSRCRQMPVRLVNFWGHQGHLAGLPTWVEDLRCCVLGVS